MIWSIFNENIVKIEQIPKFFCYEKYFCKTYEINSLESFIKFF